MDYYDIDILLALTNHLSVTFTPPTRLHIPSTRTTELITSAQLPVYQVHFFLMNGHCRLSSPLIPRTVMNDLHACASLVSLGTLYRHTYVLVSILGEQGWVDILRERMGVFSNLLFKETYSEDDLAVCDENEREVVRRAIMRYKSFR